MRTPIKRYRGLSLAASYLEKALDNIRPIVTTDEENLLRRDIKDMLETTRKLMTIAREEEP